MTPTPLRRLFASLAVLLSAACGHSNCDPPPLPPLEPRPVSILVEVVDAVSGLPLPAVRVRVLEAYQEWSDSYYDSPYQDVFLTDADGLVFLDEYMLSWQDVGFREDGIGRAMLYPEFYEDEADVLVEVDADGFPPVLYSITLRWDLPDVYVQLPFP
ncbi:MAG: hypothetical protein FJ301_07620 [Planctomycetes bacterium]|nr:hypothetical protein [Planctomycetota bacterium]